MADEIRRNKHGIPIYQPGKSCQGKAVYPSELTARIAAIPNGVKVNQYFCARCDGWHNTKAPQGNVQR